MPDSGAPMPRFPEGRPPDQAVGDYPLTVTWAAGAMVLGAFLAVVLDSFLSGYAVFTLMLGIGLTWRRSDPPIFPFIVFYQWLSITTGFWYARWSGVFPGTYRPGNIEQTMALALTGLLLLAAGIRVVSQLVIARRRRRTGAMSHVPEVHQLTTVWPLFIVVMVAYGIDYVAPVNSWEFGGLASVVQRLLEFRQVLLISLWLAIISDRRRFPLLVVSFAWTVAPRLGTYYSEFKSPLILILIVLTATWRPWERAWWPKSLMAMLKGAPLVAGLLVLLLAWQGGLKRDTRSAYDKGLIGSAPAERLAFFADSLKKELPALCERPEPYVEALVERISYITFFSRVIEYVPEREPYGNGELLKMAVTNAVLPRLLFPDKAVLPSDSYYTRRFTGIKVADGATSVSIGYMAEFYADWGPVGMFVAVLAFGCWIGLLAGILSTSIPVPFLRFGVLVVTFLSVADFEQQFIKGFAALNLNVIIMLAILHVAGPWLARVVGVTDGIQPALGAAPDIGAAIR